METDKTRKELSEIAPVLASLKKPKTEEVPAFYFSTLKENVLTKVRQDEVIEELEVIAPSLFALRTSGVLESVDLDEQSVPANYFKSLPNKVFAAIERQATLRNIRTEKTSFWGEISVWVERIFITPQLQMVLATVIAVVVLTTVYSSFSTEAEKKQVLAEAKANLTKEDIQNYVIENRDEFDELTLEENLNVEDIDV